MRHAMLGHIPTHHSRLVCYAWALQVTVRLTGHLYNRKLLEKTLDLIEAQGAVTRSCAHPHVMQHQTRIDTQGT